MFTIAPARWRSMCRPTACATRNAPLRFTATTRSHASSGKRLGGMPGGGPRALDQDVDPAEPLDDRRHQRLDGLAPRHVDRQRHGRLRELGQERGVGLGPRQVEVGDDDAGAGLPEPRRDRRAQPAGPAGDEGHLAVEAEEPVDEADRDEALGSRHFPIMRFGQPEDGRRHVGDDEEHDDQRQQERAELAGQLLDGQADDRAHGVEDRAHGRRHRADRQIEDDDEAEVDRIDAELEEDRRQDRRQDDQERRPLHQAAQDEQAGGSPAGGARRGCPDSEERLRHHDAGPAPR